MVVECIHAFGKYIYVSDAVYNFCSSHKNVSMHDYGDLTSVINV